MHGLVVEITLVQRKGKQTRWSRFEGEAIAQADECRAARKLVR